MKNLKRRFLNPCEEHGFFIFCNIIFKSAKYSAMRKFFVKFVGVMFAILFVIIALNVQVVSLYSLPDEAIVTYEDIEDINSQNIFGNFVSAGVTSENVSVGGEKQTKTKLSFKLFGIIPIKSVDVEITDSPKVYVGGIPLGFSLKTKGVIVVGENSVQTEDGSKITIKNKPIKSGDILYKINGTIIEEVDEIPVLLEGSSGERTILTIIRDDKEMEIEVIPELDVSADVYKLGLWVRDDASGVGTLTFVNSENNRFGALGHPITDYETGVEVPVLEGKIYKCSLIGITKGERGKPGELKCLFMQGDNYKGTVDTNCAYGVYGDAVKLDSLIDNNLSVDIGSRMCVRPGKAKLVSSISGVREEYDIEIIKASYQPKSSDKSMVIRVTDSRLLALTGGIVQGMSGSPILQDGKLVGAVTHVFLSDPTKGYGVYVDWMLENA